MNRVISIDALKKIYWTKQLYSEYERLLYQFRLSLRAISIEIVDSISFLGLWDSGLRKISLSSHCISKYPWSVVMEVFKHEIAHQIVAELFARPEEGHGEEFQRACRLLGMETWAMRACLSLEGLDISMKLREASEDKENPILRKIEKLLALSQSCNPHEALQAMTKAQELAFKFQEELFQEKSDSFTTLAICHKKKRVENYQAIIGSLLVEHFFVQVIYASEFDAEDMCEYKTIEILGIPRNVKMAEYVYWFLYNNIKLLWENYIESDAIYSGRIKKAVRTTRKSFYEGVLNGFKDKLAFSNRELKSDPLPLQSRILQTSSSSLIKLQKKELDYYVQYRFPRLRTSHSRSSCRDRNAYEAGTKKGRELHLNKGVRTKSTLRIG